MQKGKCVSGGGVAWILSLDYILNLNVKISLSQDLGSLCSGIFWIRCAYVTSPARQNKDFFSFFRL